MASAGDRMEETSVPARAIAPALAKKKKKRKRSGIGNFWTETLKIPSITSSLNLWHPPKTPSVPNGAATRRWYFFQPGSLSNRVKQNHPLTCIGTCSASKKYAFIILSH